MVKYEMIDLPKIAIMGKEGLCTKEKNVVQELWQQANSNFSDIADLGMKNADGSFVGFWGAMSDETLSFLPWTDDFSRGLLTSYARRRCCLRSCSGLCFSEPR